MIILQKVILYTPALGSLTAYLLNPWDPVGQPLDPLGPCRYTHLTHPY